MIAERDTSKIKESIQNSLAITRLVQLVISLQSFKGVVVSSCSSGGRHCHPLTNCCLLLLLLLFISFQAKKLGVHNGVIKRLQVGVCKRVCAVWCGGVCGVAVCVVCVLNV